jgi:nicotinamide mononucleotide adenylyltransferase
MTWNNRAPTALLIGRYQPWHDGHTALFKAALERADQVLIAVRDTKDTDEKNPFDFGFVKGRIERALAEYNGRFQVILLPNITNVVYGRDVGYKIEQVHLGAAIESISATAERAKMGI